jgi:hypothetical protein
MSSDLASPVPSQTASVVASASGAASPVADAAEAAFRMEVLDLMRLEIFAIVLGLAFVLSLVAMGALAVAARR